MIFISTILVVIASVIGAKFSVMEKDKGHA
jgi:hypothetical protein